MKGSDRALIEKLIGTLERMQLDRYVEYTANRKRLIWMNILSGMLRGEPGILPAYHMSKVHWITVLLDGTADDDRLRFLIRHSFDLTKRKKRKT